jgi:hypothetical protein
MSMKLQWTTAMALMPSSIGSAFSQSVDEFEEKHLASIATPEGKAYETVAASHSSFYAID